MSGNTVATEVTLAIRENGCKIAHFCTAHGAPPVLRRSMPMRPIDPRPLFLTVTVTQCAQGLLSWPEDLPEAPSPPSRPPGTEFSKQLCLRNQCADGPVVNGGSPLGRQPSVARGCPVVPCCPVVLQVKKGGGENCVSGQFRSGKFRSGKFCGGHRKRRGKLAPV